VKFCQFVGSLYPHLLTSFGRFILIFNKMALILTVLSFEFQQDRLPWLHRYYTIGWVIWPVKTRLRYDL